MKKGVIILVTVVIVAILIFIGIGFFKNHSVIKNENNINPDTNVPDNSDISNSKDNLINNWEAEGSAIPGTYADAEVVNFGDKYRLYYSEEPEVAGFTGKVYSAVSNDGITWTQEQGIRKERATFVSVIKLPNGKFRMYFQNAGEIKSALSSDGLSWQDEQETRIDTSNNLGLILENVAAPTVMKIGDKYIMVYRGDIAGKYSNEVPNSNTQILLWADSDDGLIFSKKGIAIDSRNSVLQGLADGPEFVDYNGEIRIYFWSYSGVYYSIFKNNEFSKEKFDFSTNSDSNIKFYPNPPSDPTIIKIENRWFMYYGQHSKGIYYATQY